MWIYEEEQKCINEMEKYLLEVQAEILRRKWIEKVLGNPFVFEW